MIDSRENLRDNMQKLVEYVHEHTERGACKCGKCIDASENPEQHQPTGHTVDMIFFEVSAKPTASAETLRLLVKAVPVGEFCNVDLFDGAEHGYMELGGWIGDQGTALMLMGLGTSLGLWNLLSPVTMLGLKSNDPLTQKIAGMGMVSIQADKKAAGVAQEVFCAVPCKG